MQHHFLFKRNRHGAKKTAESTGHYLNRTNEAFVYPSPARHHPARSIYFHPLWQQRRRGLRRVKQPPRQRCPAKRRAACCRCGAPTRPRARGAYHDAYRVTHELAYAGCEPFNHGEHLPNQQRNGQSIAHGHGHRLALTIAHRDGNALNHAFREFHRLPNSVINAHRERHATTITFHDEHAL